MINGDITLDILNGKFSYRVGAIIIDSNEILMAKDEKTSFYYTIGGRVRFGETAKEAILREIFEETQLRLELGELKFVHENFFTSYEGTVYHEISFFYSVKSSAELRIMKHAFFDESYGEVTLHWLPIDELATLDLYPEFFKTESLDSDGKIKCFITKNNHTYSITDHESK